MRSEPIVALAFVEHYLQRAETESQESQADIIDFESRALRLLHVWRIGNQTVGEKQGNDTDWDVDEKNPAPVEIVGDPSAESGAYGRSEHDSHAVDRERHPSFSRWKCISEDCLFTGLQTSAAHSLEDAKENQHAKTGCKSAQK